MRSLRTERANGRARCKPRGTSAMRRAPEHGRRRTSILGYAPASLVADAGARAAVALVVLGSGNVDADVQARALAG